MNKTQLLDLAEKLSALSESIRTACEPEERPQTEQAGPAISLEQIRAVLAEKSRQGFTEDVKNLIRKYGAERLSDIAPALFPEMLSEAEGIGNA